MEEIERRKAVVVGPGAYLSGALCLALWVWLRDDIRRKQRDGAQVRPELAEALDVLRAAGHGHLVASQAGDVRGDGHPAASTPDIGASCDHALISTGDLAARLGVSERHARRVAEAEGVTPVRRGWWRTEDAAVLQAARR